MIERAGWTDFQRAVHALDARLEVLRKASAAEEGAILRGAGLAELETCRELLRVADAELCPQHGRDASATATVADSDVDRLRRALDALADTPLDVGLGEVVDRIARFAKQAVPGATGVRVVLDGLVDATDCRQLALDPALDSDRSPTTTTKELPRRTGQEDADRREPAWSVPMATALRPLGALEFFTADGAELSADELAAAGRYARTAATLLDNARALAEAQMQAENLRRALESRAVIEQAKGVIMALDRCSADEAFARLRIRSQHSNTKLRDVAGQLLDALRQQETLRVS